MKRNSLIVVLMLLVINAISQEWTEPVNISTMNGVNQTPDLFIDKNGYLHCVWSHRVESFYSHIYYSKSIDNGQTWSNPINVSQNTTKWLLNPKIVVDSVDNIYVTYDYGAENPMHCKILMITFNGLEWSLADTISGTMLNCFQNLLAIDNNDRIYCFWNNAVQYYGDYYYRYFENGIWSDFFYPYGTGVGFDKIVIDPDNNLHVLGGHVVDSDFYLAYFGYSLESDLWTDINSFSAKTNGLGSDIDLDNNNKPHFAWRQKTPDIPNPFEEDSTMYRYFDGNSWSEPELVTEDPFSQKIQLINNKAFIMNAEKNSDGAGDIVLYQKDDEGNWIGESVISIVGSIQRLTKYSNALNFIYTAKPDDDNLNIYYMNRIMDTTTNIELNNFNIKTLNLYPNPVNSELNIDFSVLNKSMVSIKVYLFTGKLIKTIESKLLDKGEYLYKWDGTINSGQKVKSGIYLVRLQAGKNIISRSVEFLN
jgi:hypothetical protein